MRRIRELIAAGKLGTSDEIIFKHKSSIFTARVRSNGSIVSNPSATRPDPMIFDSPSNFVNEMALSVLDLSQKHRPRLFLNGWDECFVNGRSLCALRSEMYREKDSNPSIHTSSHDKKHASLSGSDSRVRHSPSVKVSRKVSTPPRPASPPASASQRTPPSSHNQKLTSVSHSPQSSRPHVSPANAQRNSAERSNIPSSRPARNVSALLSDQNHQLRQPNSRSIPNDKGDYLSKRRLPDKNMEGDVSMGGALRHEISGGRIGSDVKERARVKHLERDPHVKNENSPSNDVPVTEGDARGLSAASMQTGDESNSNASPQTHFEHRKRSNDELRSKSKEAGKIPGSASAKERGALALKEGAGIGHSKFASKEDDAKIREMGVESFRSKSEGGGDVKSYKDGGNDDIGANREVGSVEEEEEMERGVSAEVRNGKLVSKGKGGGQGKGSDGAEGEAKEESGGRGTKNVTTNVSSWPNRLASSGKRKKAEDIGDDTGPLRQKRVRRESNKGPRGWEQCSLTSRRVEKLDPETMEAVAVAARAEKEEESRRGRRTTRLAAGKIKQVDYNVTSNVVSGRPGSEKHDVDEDEDEDDDDDEDEDDMLDVGDIDVDGDDGVVRVGDGDDSKNMREHRKTEKASAGSNDSESVANSCRNATGGSSKKRALHDEAGGSTRLKCSKRPSKKHCSGSDWKRTGGLRLDDDTYFLNEDDATGKDVDTNKNIGPGKPVEMCTAALKVEKEQVEVMLENRRDALGWTIEQLTCIGECVRSCNSVSTGKIVESLRRRKDRVIEERKFGDVRRYLERALKSMGSLSRLLKMKSEEISVKQLLSFICGDIRRLETGGLYTGYPRRPLGILQVVNEEEQNKASIQKDVKKVQRDCEDIRMKLENEIDSRRKAELDIDQVRVQCLDAKLSVEREVEKQRKLNVEMNWMERCEKKTICLVKETKNLFSKLRGEHTDVDGELEGTKDDLKTDIVMGSTSRAGKVKSSDGQNCFVTGEKRGEIFQNGDAEMSGDALEKRKKRSHEMDRLRWLIATKEAECEKYQRMCERERMQAVAYKEEKLRLEKEVQGLSMARRGGSSGGGSGANLLKDVAEAAVTTVKSSSKVSKDNSGKEGGGKKNEPKWTADGNSNKGAWSSGRGKGGHGTNGGKSVAGQSQTGASRSGGGPQQTPQAQRGSSHKAASWAKSSKATNNGGGKSTGGEIVKQAKRKGNGGGGGKHQGNNGKAGNS